jgi:hypothetical protein
MSKYVYIYGNITHSNDKAGILVTNGSHAVSEYNYVYDNTSYGNTWGNLEALDQNAGKQFNNNSFRNNILKDSSGMALKCTNGACNIGGNGSGNIYICNDLGAERRNFINWNGIYYSTCDEWRAALGCGVGVCDNQVESNCSMTNLAPFVKFKLKQNQNK